jgi:hypothetical protein
MTIPIWPASLPQRLLLSNYSEALPDSRLQSKTDVGPPKSRRRTSSAVAPLTGEFHVNRDQWRTLIAFWNVITDGGNLPFMFPDQTFDGEWLRDDTGAQIYTESGVPIGISAVNLVMFNQVPAKVAPLGNLWRVSFSVNILP